MTEEAYINEINWFIDNYLNDDYENEEDKEILKNITDEDIRDIADILMNDDDINERINNSIRYYLFHR